MNRKAKIVADIDISIRTAGRNYLVDIDVHRYDSAVNTQLVREAPMMFDLVRLREISFDNRAYGKRLTEMVFADEKIRTAWAQINGLISGAQAAIRLRLHVDPQAVALHPVRWETLRDPFDQYDLCRNQQILFSRFVATADPAPVPILPRSRMHTLLILANPQDLSAYQLAEVPVQQEQARITKAIGKVPYTVLASDEGSRVTLDTLLAALSRGCQVLYMVCHGTLDHGEPYVWLEHADGRAHRVSGKRLVEHIRNLAPSLRPLLVVFASCQSAGNLHHNDAITALGPLFTQAGVSAVIGMQGDVPVLTVEQLMPQFFRFLYQHGQIDLALSQARNALSDDHPWWMPVLFMRVRDGRIWEPSQVLKTVLLPIVAAAALIGCLTLGMLVGMQAGAIDCSAGVVIRNWRMLHDAPSQVLAITSPPGASSPIYAATINDGLFRSDNGVDWQLLTSAVTGVSDVEIHPQDATILYMSSIRQGVWQSTDAGRSWHARNNGLPTLDIRTLAIDPQKPDHIYAGTWGNGIYHSQDSGGSWDVLSRDWPVQIVATTLLVDPVDPTLLYAGTSDQGLFLSRDGGQSWSWTGLRDGDVRGISRAVSSRLSPVYVTIWGKGVFRSTDNGQTWVNVSGNLPDLEVRTPVVIDPQDGSIVYVGTWNGGLFASMYGGETWFSINNEVTVVRVIYLDQQDNVFVGARRLGAEGLFAFNQVERGWGICVRALFDPQR